MGKVVRFFRGTPQVFQFHGIAMFWSIVIEWGDSRCIFLKDEVGRHVLIGQFFNEYVLMGHGGGTQQISPARLPRKTPTNWTGIEGETRRRSKTRRYDVDFPGFP